MKLLMNRAQCSVQNESYAPVDDHHFDNHNQAFEEEVAQTAAQQNAADRCIERQPVTKDLPETREKTTQA